MSAVSFRPASGELYIDVPAESLRDEALGRTADGQRLMTMMGRDTGEAIELMTAFDAGTQIETLCTALPLAAPCYPALTPVIPAADWYERELAELLGVQPEGHPDLRVLLVPAALPPDVPPLRKTFPGERHTGVLSERPNIPVRGTGVFTIPYGPVRSGVFESNQFIVATAGEDLLHVDMQIGFVHRGVEKRFETLPLERAVLLAERVSGTGTIAHSTAFCQAVERALRLSVPPAARWLRVLFAELERLYNHYDVIARLCDDASLSIGQAQFAILKEQVLRLNARLSGSRFLRGVNQIGGVRVGLDSEAVTQLRRELRELQARSDDRISLLVRTNSFIDRLIGTAPVSLELAESFAAVGPVARAASLERDARADRPYAAYERADWEVAHAAVGDSMGRLRVRIQEITQSFSLITQALEELPDGRLAVPVPESWLESAAAYGWAESPRGEVLYWVRLGEDGCLDRCKVRSPSFVNWPIFTRSVAGNVLTDFAFAEHSFGLTQAGTDL